MWLLHEPYALVSCFVAAQILGLKRTLSLKPIQEMVGNGRRYKGGLERVARYYGRWQERSSWKAAIIDVTHPIIARGVQDLRDARGRDPVIARMLGD